MNTRTRQNFKKSQDNTKQVIGFAQGSLDKLGANIQEDKLLLKKKDKTLSKRKLKQQPLKDNPEKTTSENSSTQSNAVLKPEQQLNSSASVIRIFSNIHDQQDDMLKDHLQIEKLVRKSNYIKVKQNLIIKGYAGHSSVIFKRPILQGAFYFQIKILKPEQKSEYMENKASLRIGICSSGYSHSIPLGGKDSICYRSFDGSMIQNKKAEKFGPTFQEGDIIGVEVIIAPPHKYPKSEEKNDGSSIIFYKNREKIGCYENLKQIFYCIGISLFNYATAQLRITLNDIQYLPKGFQPIIQYLNREIPYQELKNSQIFND